MAYSNDDIEELYRTVGNIIINSIKYNYSINNLEDLQNELKKSRFTKFKETNFQDKYEGGHSLGDLLLKLADESDNLRVREFFLKNGFELPPKQEQIAAAINEEEEEQNTSSVEEDRAEPSNKNEDDQFSTSYNKIRKIVASNPNITAQEFGEKLKQSGTTDAKICDLFIDILRPGKDDIVNDHDTFLKTIELLAKSNIKIDIGDTVSKTVLDYAVVGEQLDVIKIFLNSGKFDQERKSNALSIAINGSKVQEFEIFLDYIDHAEILNILNTAPHNESAEVMKILLNNKRFTEEEKVQALSDAIMDGNAPRVKLLLDYMTGIPEDGIRNLLEIIEEEKLSLREKLEIDSEFKEDPNNSDHHKYYSNIAIIKLLESSIEKKNTPHVEKENTGTDQTAKPSNEQETKYKESTKDFYTSLAKDVVGVVITGLFVAAAVMVPSATGAVVCGVAATLIAIVTGLHIASSTLPSYREMRENKVECVNSNLRTC
ncbi:Ankyrin repeats (3 copies) [Wolbachia endosymbiont of Cylisticus convexus]|uniref:ankyrin repeat domain-containing protein n=1 Tax=Wolbachia endosymbiont of Cylisticus convexus TaxID=118728 RepID=UPI000E1846D1|nr:ankyrin repeat domain-containing protein [Wolbachia endosymbiont of Cylisticus convexus]RDD35507.1 Ankyrin repeats (3 copies) [Wolbachia endosymbiont of Cylisticus convexus]